MSSVTPRFEEHDGDVINHHRLCDRSLVGRPDASSGQGLGAVGLVSLGDG